MRIALISDVHGNLTALESVILDINKRVVDFSCSSTELQPLP